MSDLRKLVESVAEFGKRLMETDGSVLNMFVGQDAAGLQVPIVAPMEAGAYREKDQVAEAVRATLAMTQCVRYVLLSEVWTLDDVSKRPKAGGSWENVPERKEGLMVVGEDIDGSQIMAKAIITRPANGKPVVSKYDYIETGVGATKMTGRFSGLLPKQDITATTRH